MNLARYIRERDWDKLEEAWTEHILGAATPEPALEALEVAGKRKEIPRCLNLVREHGDMLIESGRAEAAARMLGQAMLLGGSPGELAKPLLDAAEAAWGEEPFWEPFLNIAGFHAGTPDPRAAWRSFELLQRLEPGRVLYHAKGWGLGQVLERDLGEEEITVSFLSGRRDRIPLRSAIDIFEVLDEDDLRALAVLDPDELKRRIKKEPLEILRWVLGRNQGRATHANMKLALMTLGVEGSRFTVWWKKARQEAETSPWFEVSGPATRAQVRLLDEASDPAEGLRRQLMRSKSLPEALTRVRALLAGDAEEELREVALRSLEELAAAQADEPLSSRLAAWLYLREVRQQTPAILTALLEEAAARPGDPDDRSQAPALWVLFQEVPGVREQERCVELLRETVGERWLDDAAKHLPHAPAGMARPLIEALAAAGRDTELADHYFSLLARPTRHPVVLVDLASHVEKALARGGPAASLPPLQRLQCLLQLAVHLYRQPASDARLARARTRLTALLAEGKNPLLPRLIAGADVEILRGFASQLEAGVDRAVDRLFTKVAIGVSADVFRGEDRPFWQTRGIWTTRAGLQAREKEFQELRDVKIPENAEAIGRAASYGDLSENSEWEAAIEEQRHLTNRAMELEAALRSAQLIENVALPENTVAPGTRVRYREVANGQEHTVRILGPWDDGADVISYKSPVGAGMLGCQPGDTVTVQLPGGEADYTVLAVEPLHL